jgi:hypothetical protein
MRLDPRPPIRVTQATADVMTAETAHTAGISALLHRRQQVALIQTAGSRRWWGRMALPLAARTGAVRPTPPLRALGGRGQPRDHHGAALRRVARVEADDGRLRLAGRG